MIDIKMFVGIITVILGIIAFVPYLRDTLQGKTLPHLYTWFAWGINSLTAFALQAIHGAGAGAWVTLTASLMAFLIFALSFKNGVKNITKVDTFFFVVAILSLFLWLVADEPVLSAILLVSAGFFAFIPTLRKSWNMPYSETLSTYAINAFRHGLSFIALTNYTFLTIFFPISWGIMNFIFVIILLLRRRVSKAPKNTYNN
jgi:hypothetical protein